MNNQLILGLGNDIIEIQRIRENIAQYGQHFLDRLFSAKEQAYCLQYASSHERFAGRFSAKEAISKALKVGIGAQLSWEDMEILPSSTGEPLVTFSSRAKQRFSHPTILLSISHCHDYAVATAIWLAASVENR